MIVDVAADSVGLAEVHFGANLVMAFVGGSRALGNPRPTSDVDVFVLIDHSDREAEAAFAKDLRALHHRSGLYFDHCGELFSEDTLKNLLDFTEDYIAIVPEVQSASCYQGGCLLSIFRKGHVVFNFLAAPKLHIRDIGGVLPLFEDRSRKYIDRWNFDFPVDHTEVQLPFDSPQERLREQWRWRGESDSWLHTPIGVGLERWFGHQLRQRQRNLSDYPHRRMAPPAACECPLTTPNEIYEVQCLGVSDISKQSEYQKKDENVEELRSN